MKRIEKCEIPADIKKLAVYINSIDSEEKYDNAWANNIVRIKTNSEHTFETMIIDFGRKVNNKKRLEHLVWELFVSLSKEIDNGFSLNKFHDIVDGDDKKLKLGNYIINDFMKDIEISIVTDTSSIEEKDSKMKFPMDYSFNWIK